MTRSIEAMYLRSGYSRDKGKAQWYRDLTVAEAKRTSGTLYAIDKHGNVRECRTNGAPKTWKRSPGCELSLKYGLYENFRVGNKESLSTEPISLSHQVRIVVPVNHEFLAETPPEIVVDWVLEKEIHHV